jgi:hypothetical protein
MNFKSIIYVKVLSSLFIHPSSEEHSLLQIVYEGSIVQL